MVGIVADPEEANLDDVMELADHLDQQDIAVAIEVLEETPDEELEDGDARLPFYEEDRELAFALGLVTGAIMERNAIESEDDEDEDETVDDLLTGG